MKKLLPVGILSASLAGCGYFNYAVEPIKEVEPKKEPAENDFCETAELVDGIYLGRIGGIPYVYDVDGKENRCVLIDESDGLKVIFDLGCDNKVDYIGSGASLYSRKDLESSVKYFDNLLQLGQRLACEKNRFK